LESDVLLLDSEDDVESDLLLLDSDDELELLESELLLESDDELESELLLLESEDELELLESELLLELEDELESEDELELLLLESELLLELDPDELLELDAAERLISHTPRPWVPARNFRDAEWTERSVIAASGSPRENGVHVQDVPDLVPFQTPTSVPTKTSLGLS
jgi:hypothetical protein